TRGIQSYRQVTDNKGKLVICYNCHGEGHMSRQCEEKKRVKDSQYFKDKMLLMEAKEKGAVLDAEAEAYIADVECTAPYDQLLAITTTNFFEVSHEDAYDFDVDEGPHAAAFMANLSSTSGTNGATTIHVNEDIDDNTIPYHHYQLDSEVQDVPTEVYWLPAEELATQKSNPPKPMTPFVHTRPAPKLVQSLDENLVEEVTEFMQIFDELDKEYEQCVLEKKKLQIEKKNLLIQNECLITDCIAKDICSIVLAFDRDRPLSEELCSNCVRENSEVIELDAEILKNHIDLQIKFRNSKECFKNQTIGKDDTIKKLQTQINNMSILNVDPTTGSFDKQALETELTQLKDVITSVRIQDDGFKITALTAENAKLKYKSLSKMHSEPIVPKKPKVLAPRMYAISSKYIVPPQRVNRAAPTPLPKKKQATFQEPPRPSIDPHRKQ
nr:hypothetical protein [Tanacetum cinerariifolium]